MKLTTIQKRIDILNRELDRLQKLPLTKEIIASKILLQEKIQKLEKEK
jgi:hypothetical protein